MDIKHNKYLHIGRACDLAGKDRLVYQALEILPGVLSWGSIFGLIFLSWAVPLWAAFFIITFDIYWLVKTAYLSFHLRSNWKRMKHNINLDWAKRMENIKYDNIWQLVILPFYKEDFGVISKTVEALIESKWDKEKMIIVLAREDRAGENSKKTAEDIFEKYKGFFGEFILTSHSAGLPGEMAGKGSNISFAAREAKEIILDKKGIKYEDVLVSAFDIDTRVYSQYFLCLTWNFLTAENPYRSSFQPVPVYNNNIWQAPAFSRVVATSGTFWQMIQQERPERLATFSSHSISFKALHDIGYWQKNMVSEDSRIFWNAFSYYNGDYKVVPLSYPVSMDANLAPSFFETIKNTYKQQRRWAWGVENIPYILFSFLKNKKIPFRKKFHVSFVQLEGFWSLATNPIIIFLLGWLPLTLGGQAFNKTLLSYNLPIITRNLMALAMAGLILSVIVSMSFLPPKPKHRSKFTYFFMVIQWALVPLTINIFGSIPALDAQTRLMFGRYMGFWVTPKEKIKR